MITQHVGEEYLQKTATMDLGPEAMTSNSYDDRLFLALYLQIPLLGVFYYTPLG